MKPVRLLKKLASATAAGLLMLGIVAGTASAAHANGRSSGDVGIADPIVSSVSNGDSSGDVGSEPVMTPASSGDVA